MKIVKFFNKLFKSETKPVKVNLTKEVVKKVETEEKNNKCNMCGGYSGNYILCNTCSVILSVG